MDYYLGTAQLGMKYGINNFKEKLSDEEVHDILREASLLGINHIDTAAAYGDSERRIGEYHTSSGIMFKVCTKLAMDGICGVRQAILKSLQTLHLEKIHIYYMHSFSQLEIPSIEEELKTAKTDKLIENIGVSIYTPEELEIILKTFSNWIDYVQIPYNILNASYWYEQIRQANKMGIKIIVRSVYLQGAMFKDPDDELIKKLQIGNAVNKLRNFSNHKKINFEKLLVDYVKSCRFIDGVILGCESIMQLKKNMVVFESKNSLSNKDRESLDNLTKDLKFELLDPRGW